MKKFQGVSFFYELAKKLQFKVSSLIHNNIKILKSQI